MLWLINRILLARTYYCCKFNHARYNDRERGRGCIISAIRYFLFTSGILANLNFIKGLSVLNIVNILCAIFTKHFPLIINTKYRSLIIYNNCSIGGTAGSATWFVRSLGES